MSSSSILLNSYVTSWFLALNSGFSILSSSDLSYSISFFASIAALPKDSSSKPSDPEMKEFEFYMLTFYSTIGD